MTSTRSSRKELNQRVVMLERYNYWGTTPLSHQASGTVPELHWYQVSPANHSDPLRWINVPSANTELSDLVVVCSLNDNNYSNRSCARLVEDSE
jgi:hypothetical protein